MQRLGLALFGVVVGALLLEFALQLGQRVSRPEAEARDVLYLDPDPRVGWKQPASFEYVWTGRNPDCVEFQVEVATNSLGFRDVERSVIKPEGSVRVALLGDSLVEALQVPLEETAGAQLEARLARDRPWPGARRYEVLNFGVSNHGLGQFALVYDAYAEAFEPDVVVVLVAHFHMVRTATPRVAGGLGSERKLSIRPTFTVDAEGRLASHPARDYEAYVSAHREALATRHGPDRSAALPASDRGWLARSRLLGLLVERWPRADEVPARPVPGARPARAERLAFPHAALNYRILEDLAARLRARGARLVFADVFEFLNAGGLAPDVIAAMAASNERFAEDVGAGYIDLSRRLFASKEPVRFRCDGHLNERGHRLFADALADWMAGNAPAGRDPGSRAR